MVRQPTLGVNVLIVYEDFVSGLRAKYVLDQLAWQPGLPADHPSNWWRLDLLRGGTFRSVASAQAVTADIVMLSAHGSTDTLKAFHVWSGEWIFQRGPRPGALVISLDEAARSAPDATATRAALQNLADSAGMQLFPHFGELPVAAPSLDSVPIAVPYAENIHTLPPPTVEALHQTPYLSGGIND